MSSNEIDTYGNYSASNLLGVLDGGVRLCDEDRQRIDRLIELLARLDELKIQAQRDVAGGDILSAITREPPVPHAWNEANQGHAEAVVSAQLKAAMERDIERYKIERLRSLSDEVDGFHPKGAVDK